MNWHHIISRLQTAAFTFGTCPDVCFELLCLFKQICNQTLVCLSSWYKWDLNLLKELLRIDSLSIGLLINVHLVIKGPKRGELSPWEPCVTEGDLHLYLLQRLPYLLQTSRHLHEQSTWLRLLHDRLINLNVESDQLNVLGDPRIHLPLVQLLNDILPLFCSILMTISSVIV